MTLVLDREDVLIAEHLAQPKPELLLLVLRGRALHLDNKHGPVPHPCKVEVRLTRPVRSRRQAVRLDEVSQAVLGSLMSPQAALDQGGIDFGGVAFADRYVLVLSAVRRAKLTVDMNRRARLSCNLIRGSCLVSSRFKRGKYGYHGFGQLCEIALRGTHGSWIEVDREVDAVAVRCNKTLIDGSKVGLAYTEVSESDRRLDPAEVFKAMFPAWPLVRLNSCCSRSRSVRSPQHGVFPDAP